MPGKKAPKKPQKRLGLYLSGSRIASFQKSEAKTSQRVRQRKYTMTEQTELKPVEFNLSTFQPKHIQLIQAGLHPALQFVMASGGIRSGKSIALTTIVIMRAMLAPGSIHGIFHAQANTCYRNLFIQTIPETFVILFGQDWWDSLKAQTNKSGSPAHYRVSDREIILPNGSKIMFLGLDDPEKLRGLQFSTVWVNEGNQVDYKTIMTLQGRLSQSIEKLDGSTLETKFLLDLNPTVKSSWEYQLFVEGVVPHDGKALPEHIRDKYFYITINAIDNKPNLPANYFENFDVMSQAQRLRDEHGIWASDNPNALFKMADIQREAVNTDNLTDIVVAIDPAGSSHKKSDMTGIVVAGKDDAGRYYVLEDATLKASPERWAQKAVDLFAKWGASRIVAEKNCGGEMVETVLRTARGAEMVPIRLVHATRNKMARAQPVSVLYERHKVYHRNDADLAALEQQMTDFDAPTFKASPDRVDSLVWALLSLSKHKLAQSSVSQHNLWR